MMPGPGHNWPVFCSKCTSSTPWNAPPFPPSGRYATPELVAVQPGAAVPVDVGVGVAVGDVLGVEPE
jgi:hypothetical protein